MKKTILWLLIVAVVSLVGCGQETAKDIRPNPEKTEPADGLAKPFVTRGKTYFDHLDITGDGIEDQVQVVCYGDSEEFEGYAKGWDIVVNDELAYDLFSGDYMQPEISFYMLDEKCLYIGVRRFATGGNVDGYEVYQMQGDRFVQICDLFEPVRETSYEEAFYPEIIYAEGTKITVAYYSQHDSEIYPQWKMVYVFGEGWEEEGDIPFL